MYKCQALLLLVVVASPSYGLAEAAKMRVASESEIRDYIGERNKDINTKGNGYSYVRGNPHGYKIANGEICVLFPNGQKDCVSVETDGHRFEMITRKGDRSALD